MSTARAPVLEVRGLTKSYGGVRVVDDVDVAFGAGEIVGLVGKNGAGKSTLIKMLAGAVAPDAGTIVADGAPARIHTPRDAAALGLAFVHQHTAVAPELTVAENVRLGLGYPKRLGLVDRRRLRREAAEVLDRFGIALDPGASAGSLSVVQQRLVMLARGLAADARLVVLDEPTASLTPQEVESLHATLLRLRDAGKTIVYVSHRLHDILEVSSRVVVMRDGRVVDDLSLEGVDHDALVARIVGDADPVPHEVAAPRAPAADAPTVLRVDGVSVAGRLADVSFSVRAGEVLGIAGLVGAGRSELLRVLAGADEPLGGRVEVAGRALRLGSPGRALRAGVVLLPEERATQGLVPTFRVWQNITLPTLRRHRIVPALPVPSVRSERATATRAVERLGIKATPGQGVGTLSGGNQQKVVLAKWLEHGADVFLFDEPTHGIDVGGKQDVYRLLAELAAEGHGVVFVSSEFAELVEVSTRVLVLRDGELAAELQGAEITEAAILRHCFGGAAAEAR